MSSHANDCLAIGQRIMDHNLYINAIQDQLNKLDSHGPDVSI